MASVKGRAGRPRTEERPGNHACIGEVTTAEDHDSGVSLVRDDFLHCNQISKSFHLLRLSDQPDEGTYLVDHLKFSIFNLPNYHQMGQSCLDSPSSKTINFSGHLNAASLSVNLFVRPCLRSVQRLPTP